jgi:hypothetical protein
VKSKIRSVEVILNLVIAGVASTSMSVFGIFAGAWGGFWTGSNLGEALLRFLFWFLPAMSVVAFLGYFKSRTLGLFGSLAISIGSTITTCVVNMKSCLAGQCTTENPVKILLGAFLVPHIGILWTVSLTLYLADVLQSNSTRPRTLSGTK